MKWRAMLANLFENPKGRKRARTAGLCLESLEVRVVPTGNNDWIGPAGGVWSDPTNWSLARVPQSGDTLTFRGPSSGGGNTSSVDDIPSLTVDGISQDTDFNATITLASGVSLTSTNDFTTYGNFYFAGYNTLAVSGGNFFNNGNIASDGAGNVIQASHDFVNQGTLIVTGSFLAGTPNLTLIGHTMQDGVLTIGNPIPSDQDVVVAVGVPDTDSVLDLDAGSVTTVGPGSVLTNPYHLLNLSGTLSLVDATLDTPLGVEIHGDLQISSAGLSPNSQDTINGNVVNGGTITYMGSVYQNLVINGIYSDFAGTLNMRVFGSLGGYSDSLYASGGFNLSSSGILNVTEDGPVVAGLSWGLLFGQVTGRFEQEHLPRGFASSYNDPAPGYFLRD
jgi:hypothetical protein